MGFGVLSAVVIVLAPPTYIKRKMKLLWLGEPGQIISSPPNPLLLANKIASDCEGWRCPFCPSGGGGPLSVRGKFRAEMLRLSQTLARSKLILTCGARIRRVYPQATLAGPQAQNP